MYEVFRKWYRKLGIVTTLVVCMFPALMANADELQLEDIEAAWIERENRLAQIPFKLEWTEQHLQAEESKDPQLNPPKEFLRKVDFDRIMIMSLGRMYSREKGLRPRFSTRLYEPMTTTTVWQGEKGKIFRDHGAIADSSAIITDDPQRLVDLTFRPLFLAMWPEDGAYGHLKIKEYEIEVADSTVDSIPCRRLRRLDNAALETEIDIDPAREFLIRRVVSRMRSAIERQIDIDYQQVKGIGWVPKSWKFTIGGFLGKDPTFQLTATVRSVEIVSDLKDSIFEIRFPPGLKVREQTTSGNKLYTVNSDGEFVE